MELKQMSKESVVSILEALIKLGKIMPEEVEVALQHEPTNEMKRVVDTVHGIFCDGAHDGQCEYYGESNLDQCWQMTEHKEWLRRTVELMKTLGIFSEEEFDKAWGAAKKALAQYQALPKPARSLFDLIQTR